MVDTLSTGGPISSEPAPPYTITRTAPDELVRHDISDEELQTLVDMRRDYLWEGMWVALGIAFGAAPTAITFLFEYISKNGSTAVSGGDLFHVVVLFAASSIFGVLCYVTWGKSNSARDLAKAIRERTKRKVTSG